MCAEGERLLRQGQLDAAERQFRNAHALEPRNYNVLNALALIALDRGDATAAIALLTRACELSPDQPTPRVNLGNAFARLGRYDDAIGQYDVALTLRPRDVEALYNRSTALLYSDRPEDAIDGYRRVLGVVPNHADALFNWAIASERLGRREDVAEACKRFLRSNPNDLEVHAMRLRALSALERSDDVAAALEPALKSATAAIGTAQSGDGGVAQRIADLARMLLEVGQSPRALTLLERALKKFMANAELLALHGLVLADLMRQSEAVASYDRALALRGNMTEALTHRGIALFQLGKFDAAIESYDLALHTGQGAPTVLINLVGAKKFSSGDDQHLKTIELLIAELDRFSPADQMYLHFAAGKALNDLGRYDDAFEHWRAGNAIKRQSLTYDVNADLALAQGLSRELTADWLAQRRGRIASADAAPIFVFGMPRSGTTLVEQLIGAHPRARAIGETGFVRQTLREAFKKRRAEEPYAEKVRRLSVNELAGIGEAYMALARERGGSGVRLVDKTLNTSHEAPLIAAALPNAVFVHVRRDALDNCLACYSNLFTAGHEFTYDLDELAAYRLSYDSMLAQWRRVLPPERLLEVEYEALVRNFEPQAKQILSFCGLPWTPAVLDFSKVERPVRSASAYQVRQGLFSSSIGRWRHHRANLARLSQILDTAEPRQSAAS